MIFVAGTITIDPTVVADFQEDVAAMRPKVLQEQGCRHYSLLAEDAAGGVMNVLEMWNSEEDLKIHLKQPWIVQFFNKYVGSIKDMTAQVYDSGEGRAIPQM
jgi:quinol monooxygenase YgiN